MGRIPRFAVIVGVLLALVSFRSGDAQSAQSVAARDQQLAGNLVVVESVVAPEPGWVDIHAEAEVAGNPGAVIGYAPLQPGENNYVFVPVDPARVTPVLYAVLHVDRGQPGQFEFPGSDEPVKVDGKSVTAAFHVLSAQPRPSSETPSLAVRDQALRNGEVVIGRVVASQAGWVDIHAEAEQAGNPGAVIGYSPIAAGETTYVRVAVPADKVTPVLYAVLHIDEGERGKFEFPGPDTPAKLDGRSVTAPFHLVQLSAAQAAPATASPQVVSSATAGAATASAPGAASSAAPTRTPTATQAAAPTVLLAAAATPTPTVLPTSTPTTAPPSATPTWSPAPTQTVPPSATPAPLATPSAAASSQGASAEQRLSPGALPRTGGVLGPVGYLTPPVALAVSILILLLGIALRLNGRVREDD